MTDRAVGSDESITKNTRQNSCHFLKRKRQFDVVFALGGGARLRMHALNALYRILSTRNPAIFYKISNLTKFIKFEKIH